MKGQRSRLPRLEGSLQERIYRAAALRQDGFLEREICATMGLTAQSLEVITVLALPTWTREPHAPRTMLSVLEQLRGLEDPHALAAKLGDLEVQPLSAEVLGELLERGRALRRHEAATAPRFVRRCLQCDRIHAEGTPCSSPSA
jgi:hypothetical protein